LRVRKIAGQCDLAIRNHQLAIATLAPADRITIGKRLGGWQARAKIAVQLLA
jgi:hypothetical protein